MPNPSTSWNTVTVRGTYRRIDGSAKQGTVKFTATDRVVAAGDAVIFPAGSGITVTLDVAGSFSVALPATDDPDISPAGWAYKVDESFTDSGNQTYYLNVPVAAAGTGIDLDSVVLPAASAPPASAAVRGVRGGVAALDADGDVVNAAGVKVGVFVDSNGKPYIETGA